MENILHLSIFKPQLKKKGKGKKDYYCDLPSYNSTAIAILRQDYHLFDLCEWEVF